MTINCPSIIFAFNLRRYRVLCFCLFAVLLTGVSFSKHIFANEMLGSINKSDSSNNNSILVAVASNFRYPLLQLITENEYWSNKKIKIVTGSSGTLYAQIVKGAPFDVFLSADSERPSKLQSMGLAYGLIKYAKGRLVLWPSYTKVSVEQQLISYKGKLAIANPILAPFGLAAKQVIDALPNAQQLSKQLVLGANVTQAFQFIDTGNAELGIVAESMLVQAAASLGQGRYLQYKVVPSNLYTEIIQQAVIVKKTKNAELSLQFMQFLQSENTQAKLAKLGYLSVLGQSN